MSTPQMPLLVRALLVTTTAVACGVDPPAGALAVDVLATGELNGQAGVDGAADAVGMEPSDLEIADAKPTHSDVGGDAPTCFAAPQIRPWCRLKWGVPAPAKFVKTELEMFLLGFKCAEYAPDAVSDPLDWSQEHLAFLEIRLDWKGQCCDGATALLAHAEICTASDGLLFAHWGAQSRCCHRQEVDSEGLCQGSANTLATAYRLPKDVDYWSGAAKLQPDIPRIDYPKGDPACRVWGPYDHPWPEGTGPATLPK